MLKTANTNKRSTHLQVKYAEEVRLSLGVAWVKEIGKEIEGMRAVPFDYSGKVFLSIPDYKDKIRKEISCVKGLTGKSALQYKNNQNNVDVWDLESVTLLKGCGKKLKEVLNNNGISLFRM